MRKDESGYLPIPGKDESGEGDGVMMSTLCRVCACVRVGGGDGE